MNMNQLPEHYCTLFARVTQQTASCQALLAQLHALSETPSLPFQVTSQLKQATASLSLIYEALMSAQVEAETAYLEENEDLLCFPSSSYRKKAI